MHDPVVYSPLIPPLLVDLLGKMLHRNPRERIQMREIKRHAWTTNCGHYPLLSTEENCKDQEELNVEAKKPAWKYVKKVMNV